jgi:hypothetical protein
MAKFKVIAPVQDYVGSINAVQFTDGVAIIDEEIHPAVLAYCRNAGYHVEEITPGALPAADDGDDKKRPAANASKDTWLRYAIQLGATPNEVELTKAQLIEWVNEHEGENQ